MRDVGLVMKYIRHVSLTLADIIAQYDAGFPTLFFGRSYNPLTGDVSCFWLTIDRDIDPQALKTIIKE